MNLTFIKLSSSPVSIALLGTEADRGCVRCKAKASIGQLLLLFDARGRYWHAECAGETLAEFTRTAENRGPSFHYERSFDSMELRK